MTFYKHRMQQIKSVFHLKFFEKYNFYLHHFFYLISYSTNIIRLNLKELNLNIFPEVSKEDWIHLAKEQLKGDDPIQALSWLSDSHLEMNSYYDQTDLEGLSGQIDFFQSIEPFNWKLYESVEVDDAKSANKQALEALSGGCDGVIFSIKDKIDFNALLSNILVDICDVSFHASSQLEDLGDLSGYIISDDRSTAITSVDQKNQVGSITSIIKTISDEMHILRNSSPDFFLEIASLRALRFLLFDHFGEQSNQIQIHTTLLPHPDENQQWFVNSTAGLASILGGSTSINFHTAIGSTRTSRNVGNIIREECGIRQYSDQCGGSFFVEALTNRIIQACKSDLKR